MSSCRTKRGMCKSCGINLTGNDFWSDKVSVSFVVRSDRDLAFVTISLSKKKNQGWRYVNETEGIPSTIFVSSHPTKTVFFHRHGVSTMH